MTNSKNPAARMGFAVGDYGHIHIGSDIWPVKVMNVTPSGKMIDVARVHFVVRDDASLEPDDAVHLSDVVEDAIVVVEDSTRFRYCRSANKGGFYSKGGAAGGMRLKPGFCYRRDMSK